MTELVIQSRGDSPAAALVEEGRLMAYFPLGRQPDLSPEAILLGRAGRVIKNLEALFVSLPGEQSGYLPFHDIPGGELPRSGELLLVQVKKPPQGDKAASLTMDIGLPGRYALLLPRGRRAHASARLQGEDKKALTALAARLKPQDMGLVLRVTALGVPEAQVAADVQALLADWREIEEKVNSLNGPALVRPAPAPVLRILREEHRPPRRILTDDLKRAAGLSIPVEVMAEPFAHCNIAHQLRQAFARRLILPSGGSLVVDPCEAGTVMDVNTGTTSITGSDLILKTNLEAALEAARLMRVRNLGGIILIDLIDMKREEDRQRVEQTLREALARDPVKTVVHGFTQLGIMEVSRKKTSETLAAQGLVPCPCCGGKGFEEEHQA